MKRVILKEVIALVNEGLKVMGKPPITKLPKGRPGSETCPLARAFGASVGLYTIHQTKDTDKLKKIWSSPDWDVLELPDLLHKFVIDFDTEKFPSLLEEGYLTSEEK